MRVGFLAATLLTLLSGIQDHAAAQQPQAWVIRGGEASAAREAGPFGALLDRSAELELTSSQLGRIREIQRRLVRANESLEAQIRDAELWGVASEEEEEAMAAVRERFQENASAAERDVEELLTPEQLQEAHALIEGDALAYSDPPEEEDAAGEKVPRTRVRVENLNYLDATIFVYSGARNQRMGIATGLTTQTFTVPTQLLTGGTSIRFQVRYLGRSGMVSSDYVTVNPGDEVLLRLPPI